jgi:hypothetical protein
MKQVDLRVRYGRLLGLLFCVAGFITIALGWNGMAREACPDCQLPYIVSGGAGGLGLILFGIALMVMAQIRAERNRLAQQIGEAIRPLVQATATNGAGDTKVMAAKSTYHRPGCRLVEGKSDVDQMSVAAARAKGLTPCRVCNAAEISAGSSEPSAKESSEETKKAEASS